MHVCERVTDSRPQPIRTGAKSVAQLVGSAVVLPLGDPREQCRRCRQAVMVVTEVIAVVNDVLVKLLWQLQPLGPQGWQQQGSRVVQGRAPVSLPLVGRRRQL